MDEGLVLSQRGERYYQTENLLGKGFNKTLGNLYNAETNPTGCVNLGTSENRLVFDLLKDKLADYKLQWEDSMFTYMDMQGLPELRNAVAKFLMNRAKSWSPIDPNQIIVMNGGGMCMEAVFLVLCDPGDGVMIASPFYGGISGDAELRPNCKIVHVNFHSELEEPGQKEPFQVMMSKFESVYQENTAKGVKIKMMVFMNPNNPLGDICTKEEVLEVLNFCHRHSLHVIMNEVYMNTIFKEGVQHVSVLSLKPEEIPDPDKIHFVWGASKDLAMSGMRFGVLHSLNKKVMDSIKMFTYFHLIPVYIQRLLTLLLSDKDWLNNVFFPTNNRRLREAHKTMLVALDEMGVPYLDRPSGLYIYADFRKFMPSVTKENEFRLWHRLIDNGVYIAPSQAFMADEQGWFRIIFARPLEEIKLSMRRVAKVIQEILKEQEVEISSTQSVTVASGQDKLGASGDASVSVEATGTSLDNLVSKLKSEVSKSDWLEKNTADQWKEKNPELYKEFMDNKM